MRDDDAGYIMVETIGTFVPLVLLVISILSLVNIVAVQARVHYALTQAANTISIYCYPLEVLGIAGSLSDINRDASRLSGEVAALRTTFDSALSGINSMTGNGNASGNAGGGANSGFSLAEEAAGDPQTAIGLFLNYGISEASGQIFEELVRPLVGRYLANGDAGGDGYLRRAGVVNRRTGSRGLDALEFHQGGNFGVGNSVLIDANGNIKLTVMYEVDYTFGALPLPFTPTLRITQTVITKAWLNGSGEGYTAR